jgi:hypothetical protein
MLCSKCGSENPAGLTSAIWAEPRSAGYFGLQKSVDFATVGSVVNEHRLCAGVDPGSELDLQIPVLKQAVCKKIFREKVSGASREP